MKAFTTLILMAFLISCSPYQSNLDSLGSQSSFADVEIPGDFPAPEDEEDVPEDIEITPPPVQVNLKNTFFLDEQIFNLAHGEALRWDGCVQSKPSQGGYNSDIKCGRAYFHPSFADNLNEAFYLCVSEAARAAGYSQPVQIFIRHLGSYNDRKARNSTRRSNHAYARAWDIVNFNLYDENGKHQKGVHTFAGL